MKIKTLDGRVMPCDNLDSASGELRITHSTQTAEELETWYSADKSSLQRMELLTDDDVMYGHKIGYVVYSGITLLDGVKTVHLSQEIDTSAARLTQALADALTAKTTAESTEQQVQTVQQQTASLEGATADLTQVVDSILIDILPGLMPDNI